IVESAFRIEPRGAQLTTGFRPQTIEVDDPWLRGITFETQRVDQSRGRVNRHHVDPASADRGLERETGAECSLAHATGTEADDQPITCEVERRTHRANKPSSRLLARTSNSAAVSAGQYSIGNVSRCKPA